MATGIAEIFRVLGIFGTTCVLWTVVICVALWKEQHETIVFLWPYLFWTWVILAVVMMAGLVILNIVRSIVKVGRDERQAVIDKSIISRSS